MVPDAWVQHMDTATKVNKGSLSVWRIASEQGHTLQGNKQPMDTGRKTCLRR